PARVPAPAPVFSAEPFAWPDPVARASFDGAARVAVFGAGASPWTRPLTPARTATPTTRTTPAWQPQPAQAQQMNGHANVPLETPFGTQIKAPFGTPGATQGKAAPTTVERDTLQAARELADAGRLADAAAAIHAYLEQHAPHAEAFYLLGVLADANGDSNVARAQYRKAIYLDPQHPEALAHLATLLDLEGDRDGARLLMQRAARAQGSSRA
ncbi:tetratricopeptide repeat protein, partial [Paraburkholderia sp. Cy-641]